MARLKARHELHGRLRRELANCVKCGACMAYCPVYRLDRTESSSMRGKLALLQSIEAGRPIPPGAVRKTLSRCVGCQTCRVTCPNKVDTGLATILGKWLHAPPGLAGRLLLRAARFLRRYPAGRRFLMLVEERRSSGLSPASTLRSLLKITREYKFKKICNNKYINDGGAVPAGGVALIPGCRLAADGRACRTALMLARPMGPAGILDGGCCGLPALAAGDLEGYAEAVSRLMDAILGRQPRSILFLCPECWYAWHLAPDLCDLTPEELRIWSMGADFHAALAASGWEPDARIGGRLALHEACLYARGGGDRQAPRRLLERIAAEKPVRSFREGTCCGACGGLVYDEPEMARRIADDRLDELRAAGADTVVTHCDRCRGFFLERAGTAGVRVKTLLELLGEAVKHG